MPADESSQQQCSCICGGAILPANDVVLIKPLASELDLSLNITAIATANTEFRPGLQDELRAQHGLVSGCALRIAIMSFLC